tara:strand:+ start:534 stop:755 length:222 start_codon:yes stop_codon:yes gene_type:complete
VKGELTIIFDEEEAQRVVTLLLGLDERLSVMEQQIETLLEKVNGSEHGQKSRNRRRSPVSGVSDADAPESDKE